MVNPRGGYQPDTRDPSSRRADFDLLRRVAQLETLIAAQAAAITDLTTRVETLEP